ncbi:MAG: serine/threonine protein kinase [Myxococcaceae bacterium]|nr:serine/threonine protein kinase [Myxococcaceae bacterium]
MSTCLDENELVAFGDGALTSPALERAAEHLRGCEACRAVLSSIYEAAGERRKDAERLQSGAALLPGAVVATLAPGTLIGRYRVERVRGVGGMGVVYEATDPQLARKVALKFLRHATAASTSQVLQEAQALARISHPNVVPVFDVGTHDGHVFLAMEFIEGATLADWLASSPRAEDVLAAFLQAGEGLVAAHDAGLVHRDFKPANVLRRSDGRVFVTDFGLAVVKEARGDDGLGGRPGTPAYMAPEQLAGRPVDARADQFSFCASLAEALTRVRPFAGDTPRARLEAIERGALGLDLKQVPLGVGPALRRGLMATPDERFPDMRAVLAALRPRARSRAGVMLAITVVALAVALAGYAVSRPAPCVPGADRLATTWSAEVRAAVRQAISRPAKPWSADLASTLTSALDGWASTWSRSYDDACAATHVRHEQSERLLDLRMACLERRRVEFAAVTSALASLDEKSADTASTLVRGLRSVSACEDARRLESTAQTLSERGRLEAQALQPRVSQLKVLHDSGRLADGWALAEPLLATLGSVEALSVQAEGWFWAGSLQLKLGQPAKARELLQKALTTASVNHDDELIIRSLCQLLEVASSRLHDVALSKEYRELLAVARAREPLEHELEAIIENQLGLAAFTEGELPKALAHFRAARDHYSHVTGPSAKNALRTINNAAVILSHLGKPDEALPELQAVRTLIAAELGEAHHEVGRAEVNIGVMFNDLKRFDEALPHFAAAQKNFERAYGPSHVELAAVHNNLGDTWLGLDRPADALKAFEQALSIREAALGPDHLKLAGDLVGIGAALLALHREADAVKPLERALTLRAGDAANPGELGKVEVLLARTQDAGALRRRALLDSARRHLEAGGDDYAGDLKSLPGP